MQQLTKTQVAERLPHAGAMCLLDGVTQWDAKHLLAYSDNHREIEHPLRVDDKLSSVVAIEYASQAVAVHASLRHSTAQAKVGFLVSCKQVDYQQHDLARVPNPLDIQVDLLSSNAMGLQYHVQVSSNKKSILTAKLLILLQEPINDTA